MNYDIEMSKRLSKMGLNFEYGGYKFKTYWCRVVMNESAIFNAKEHRHSFFELHLCFRGESRFLINGNEYCLKEGAYILCDRSLKHTVVSMSEDFEKFIWGFDVSSETEENSIRELSSSVRERVFFHYGDEIKTILSLIFMDAKDRPNGYIDTIKLKLYLLYTELLRASVKKKTLPKIGESEKDPRMRMIVSYIDDNILQGVRVEDVAKEFSLCERQLSRICLHNYKMTIGKYISLKKMQKAKWLLEETDKSLSEISELLGYADPYSFGKAFKKHEGMSPIKFRNSIKM